MSKLNKILNKVIQGNADANIRFVDMTSLLQYLGFHERVRGDHHIFTKDGIVDILNLQPRKGKCKPYQVKQVRELVIGYGLMENDDEK